MLQSYGYADRGLRRLGIRLVRAPDDFWRRNDHRDRPQRRLLQNDGNVRHLHFARDVQIVNGVRLRQIPTILCQRRESGHCKQEQRKQCALHKRREALAQVQGRVNSLLLPLGVVLRLQSHYRNSTVTSDVKASSSPLCQPNAATPSPARNQNLTFEAAANKSRIILRR